jgi:hypothetical protein
VHNKKRYYKINNKNRRRGTTFKVLMITIVMISLSIISGFDVNNFYFILQPDLIKMVIASTGITESESYSGKRIGANLKPMVGNFSIHEQSFKSSSDSVIDECITPGIHRIIRFDFLIHNTGKTDLEVGNPELRPDLFVYSAAHKHYHMKDFNEFVPFDRSGNQSNVVEKQGFCLRDSKPISSWANPRSGPWNCNSNQGISAGWADHYEKTLACQFVDGIADGEYTLVSTTNAQQTLSEETYEDNSVKTGLIITGDSVANVNHLRTE